VLDSVDLSLRLTEGEYSEQQAVNQGHFHKLLKRALRDDRSAVIVIEGWAGSGKSRLAGHLVESLAEDQFAVHPPVKPDAAENSRHYLYRYWRRLPPAGSLTVFIGSWYRRVLVDRVEGSVTQAEWQRAYREINAFERHLLNCGTIVSKLWVHVSPQAQTRQLSEYGPAAERSSDTTPATYGAYADAVNEMLLKTSTLAAPWVIVEGDDFNWMHVKSLRTLIDLFYPETAYQPGGDDKTRNKKKKKGKKKSRGKKRKKGK
jgi:polyphosphate kinase 2 (PPK2 family)